MSNVKKRYQGHGVHRYASNPEEKAFALAWQNECDKGAVLSYLLFPEYDGPRASRPVPSDAENKVAATVIQWLGSPVGQTFLRDMGYTKTSPSRSTK